MTLDPLLRVVHSSLRQYIRYYQAVDSDEARMFVDKECYLYINQVRRKFGETGKIADEESHITLGLRAFYNTRKSGDIGGLT